MGELVEGQEGLEGLGFSGKVRSRLGVKGRLGFVGLESSFSKSTICLGRLAAWMAFMLRSRRPVKRSGPM